jgi:hypothetical protein
MRLFRTAAGRGIVVLFVGLCVAALLDAAGLRKQAQIQQPGIERSVALAVTKPLESVSRTLRLTEPRRRLQLAIGREHEDDIDTGVHLHLPPPAGPSRPHRRQPPPKTRTPPPKPKPPAKPVFTAARPLHVWVAGDSLAQVPGDALERLSVASLDVTGVESRLSTGLARPDLYNWYTRFNQLVAHGRPQVAVLSFGADDAHDYMTGIPEGHTVGPFGSPSWIAEYRRRVEGVTRELNAAGIRTVWLGLPIPAGPGFARSFPVMNTILRSVAKEHPTLSSYVDTWHLLDSAHGTYTPYLRVHGKLTLMRLPDGVHYTEAAGDLIAAAVLQQLRAHYTLR